MTIRTLLVSTAALLALGARAAAEDTDHHDHDHAEAAPAEAKASAHAHDHGHGDEADEGEGHGHADAVTLTTDAAKTFGIVVETVRPRPLADLILAPGWITYDPAGQSLVAAPVAGRVTKVLVQVGDAVKAGDALAELVSPAFVEAFNAYILKRAASEAAELSVELAEQGLTRANRAGDSLTMAERQRRETEAKQARIAKTQADAEREAAANTVTMLGGDAAALERAGGEAPGATLVLRAPSAGTLTDRDVVVGQQVSPESPALFSIADTSRLWVVANVPEALLSKVTVGSLAELHAFNGDRVGAGDILQVSPDIDPHTRSGRTRIGIAGNASIRPGMYVQVRITPIEAGSKPQAIAVPEAAVVAFEGASVVFVSSASGDSVTFRPRPIVAGPVVGGFVPVLTGIEPGDAVVVKGAFLLKADLGKEGAEHEH